MGCRDEKTNFFQWHSGNHIEIATPAEFEYKIPSLTWNYVIFSKSFLTKGKVSKKKCGIFRT